MKNDSENLKNCQSSRHSWSLWNLEIQDFRISGFQFFRVCQIFTGHTVKFSFGRPGAFSKFCQKPPQAANFRPRHHHTAMPRPSPRRLVHFWTAVKTAIWGAFGVVENHEPPKVSQWPIFPRNFEGFPQYTRVSMTQPLT